MDEIARQEIMEDEAMIAEKPYGEPEPNTEPETDADATAYMSIPDGFTVWEENDMPNIVELHPEIVALGAVAWDRKDAVEILTLAGKGHAIKFHADADASEDMARLANSINDAKQRLKKYVEEHSVKTFAFKNIGCKKCGSQLAKDYLKDDFCPLCGNDLRGQSTIEGEQKITAKIAELEASFKEAERINHIVNGKVEWLLYM